MRRSKEERHSRDEIRAEHVRRLKEKVYAISSADGLSYKDYDTLEELVEEAFNEGELFGYDEGMADAPDGW